MTDTYAGNRAPARLSPGELGVTLHLPAFPAPAGSCPGSAETSTATPAGPPGDTGVLRNLEVNQEFPCTFL